MVGTKTKSEEEADKRDYRIDELLMSIEEDDILWLVDAFSWRWNVANTSYQNGWGSCTSLGWTHCMQIQNIKEIVETLPKEKESIYWKIWEWDNIINLKREDLRQKMWHDLDNKNDSGDYVEKMLNTLRLKGIIGETITGEPKIYFSDWFAYWTTPTTEQGIIELKMNIVKSPLVFAIRWNSNTWREMSQGRILTIVEPKDQTWWHCVAVDGFDEEDCDLLNSWSKNNWSDNISSFKIDWKTFVQMVKARMINWRYRQIFDKKDCIMDLEFYNRKMEAMNTLRGNRKMYEKWDNEDKKFFEDIQIGNYLKNKYMFTDDDL